MMEKLQSRCIATHFLLSVENLIFFYPSKLQIWLHDLYTNVHLSLFRQYVFVGESRGTKMSIFSPSCQS
jgi:hypothetical protein